MGVSDLADEWLRWAVRGMDGFASHLSNHQRARPFTAEERALITHIVNRLQMVLDDDQRRPTL